MYKHPYNNEAREIAAEEFFRNELRFQQNEIEIQEVKATSTNFQSRTLWITTKEENIKKVFKHAAIAQNNKI